MRFSTPHILLVACLETSTAFTSPPTDKRDLLCQSESQPNPIASTYPKDVTGTINGTYAILPIPYATARAIIPSQYAILRKAYENLIPNWPSDMYPAEYEGLLDHDVGTGPLVKIGDFQRSSLRFPFIDRLGDGYTSFRYSGPLLLSTNNLVALVGAGLGSEVHAGKFNPACGAYASDGQGNTFLEGKGVESGRVDISGNFQDDVEQSYGLKLFMNITNQPIFSSVGGLCDNYISLYNSSVTQGAYAPSPVQGFVFVRPPYYTKEATLDAYGYRMDLSFVERNNVACESLKGYAGTGSGDSG